MAASKNSIICGNEYNESLIFTYDIIVENFRIIMTMRRSAIQVKPLLLFLIKGEWFRMARGAILIIFNYCIVRKRTYNVRHLNKFQPVVTGRRILT